MPHLWRAAKGFGRRCPTVAGEVTRRIIASYEAGDLITVCAWCERVELDGEWVLAPKEAISAIDSKYTLSHSICPDCAANGQPSSPQPARSS